MAGRPLTGGEIALCKEIYGDSIDYSKVTISANKFHPFQPKGGSMAPNGHLYMPDTYMDDYSRGSPHYRSLFIHEMAHVWQFQNKVLNLLTAVFEIVREHGSYLEGYKYTLDAAKDLTDYNMEQQASIIEDYFMLKHEKQMYYSGVCQNPCGYDQKIALYEAVLKKFHDNPSYARKEKFPPPKLRPPGNKGLQP